MHKGMPCYYLTTAESIPQWGFTNEKFQNHLEYTGQKTLNTCNGSVRE